MGNGNIIKATSYYSIFKDCSLNIGLLVCGAVAQLVRAPALQAGCPGFESL